MKKKQVKEHWKHRFFWRTRNFSSIYNTLHGQRNHSECKTKTATICFYNFTNFLIKKKIKRRLLTRVWLTARVQQQWECQHESRNALKIQRMVFVCYTEFMVKTATESSLRTILDDCINFNFFCFKRTFFLLFFNRKGTEIPCTCPHWVKFSHYNFCTPVVTTPRVQFVLVRWFLKGSSLQMNATLSGRTRLSLYFFLQNGDGLNQLSEGTTNNPL